MRIARPLRNRRGFTLVELLITVVLASMIMIAAFMLSRTISQVFSAQDQTVDTQGNLRFGMDFVSRDLRKAGYLATPSASRDPLVCPRPNVGFGLNNLVGVRVVDGGSAAAVYNDGTANNANIFPDQLFIMGSFDSAATFPVVNVRAGQPIEFNPVRLAEGLGGTNLESRFNALFVPGRLIKITDTAGVAQLVPINARAWNGGNATVSVTGLVPRVDGRGCGIEGIAGEGYEVSVVSVVRYSVEADPNDAAKMDLIRAEISATTGQPIQIEGNPYAVPVLEYVVDFQVWLDVDGSTFGGPAVTTDDLNGDDQGNTSLVSVTARQDWPKARVGHILISARTHREDQGLPHLPRTVASAPLLTFNTNEDATGSARVITMTNSVELTNLTVRNVK